MNSVQTQSSKTTFSTPARAAGVGRRFGFGLFVMVNALLLVRPQELFPAMSMLHLYELGMLACLLWYGPKIVSTLSWRNLKRGPITLCVVTMAPVLLISIAWQSRGDLLLAVGVEYVKIVLYYLILICAIDTPARLRQFAIALAILIIVVGMVPVLDHHNLVTFENLKMLVDNRADAESGRKVSLTRVQGVGIFQDPNDLAQILGVGAVLCVYGMEISRRRWLRWVWLAPVMVMLYGIYLTHSRGGILSLMAGLGMLLLARFGWKKALLLGVIAMAAVTAMFVRSTSAISTREVSAQSRIQLWSDSLVALRQNPIFGVGGGAFTEQAGQVSHNSFLQAFAETGVLGGMLFFTAFFAAIWGIQRLRAQRLVILDFQLARLAPALLAALACYTVGMLSLTRNYVIPTYTLLGLATVYLGLVRTYPRKPPLVCGLSLLGRSFALCLAYLLAMQVFVRVFVSWG